QHRRVLPADGRDHPRAEHDPHPGAAEHRAAAVAGGDRDHRAGLDRHRLPAEEGARGALPRRQPPRRGGLRADAFAADAPAAAAEAPGQARGAALSATPFAGDAAGARLSELGGLRDVVRQELVSRQLDEQMAARFAVGRRLRVLDVGMGQGTQALRLARAGHTVTGLERDATMIAAAREALAREPEGIRARMRIIEGDGRDTGVHFLPGSFDVVLCHGVLMYVEEPDPLVAGLARMLAPGGLL